MYPYIQIMGFKIFMTGIGIVTFILSTILLIRFYSKKYGLNFWKFFNRLPVFLIIPYILGGYTHYLLEEQMIIPWSINDFLMILTSYGYKFHFIGVSSGIIISILLFLKSINLKPERTKWIDIFFYSISLALIPMGLFFVLGDNFIGIPSKSPVAITAFLQDSELYKIGKVYPVGLLLSFIGILSFLLTFIVHYVFKKTGGGILGFLILMFLFNFVFIYQKYSKHLVIDIFNYTVDIKNYWTILICIGIIRYYKTQKQ